jgi:hypothetical protein
VRFKWKVFNQERPKIENQVLSKTALKFFFSIEKYWEDFTKIRVPILMNNGDNMYLYQHGSF